MRESFDAKVHLSGDHVKQPADCDLHATKLGDRNHLNYDQNILYKQTEEKIFYYKSHVRYSKT